MPQTLTLGLNLPALGGSYAKNVNITVGSLIQTRPVALIGPAKTGTLTTRTNNTDGSLTMTAGHGITTGARLDIYWNIGGVKGSRRGAVVGTVAGNVVPITGGFGDNLPAAASAITAMVPTQMIVAAVGNNVLLLAGYTNKRGSIVYTDGADARLTDWKLDDGESDLWYSASGATNPLAGVTVARVYFSTADAVIAADMKSLVGY